jgi:hypothetical protein
VFVFLFVFAMDGIFHTSHVVTKGEIFAIMKIEKQNLPFRVTSLGRYIAVVKYSSQ